MTSFQKGDIVKLKSGGPKMTVSNTGNYSRLGIQDGVACIWFEGNKKFEDVFDAAVLEIA